MCVKAILFDRLIFQMRETSNNNNVFPLFVGEVIQPRDSANNYPNDSLRPSLYLHSRTMAEEPRQKRVLPRGHMQMQKKKAYQHTALEWPYKRK